MEFSSLGGGGSPTGGLFSSFWNRAWFSCDFWLFSTDFCHRFSSFWEGGGGLTKRGKFHFFFFFFLNPSLRNGWVMVRLEIVQRCMEYCSAAGSMFCLQTSSFPSSCKISAHSVRKWLWYSQYKHLLLMGGWVGWDRKVIIKSSRTFNPKFLTQSFSRLKFFCNTNFFVTYNFLGLKFFGPKLFWDPNIFRMRIFFKTKNFLQPKFFGTIWNR